MAADNSNISKCLHQNTDNSYQSIQIQKYLFPSIGYIFDKNHIFANLVTFFFEKNDY